MMVFLLKIYLIFFIEDYMNIDAYNNIKNGFMKKWIKILVLFCLLGIKLSAQTWNGSISSSWTNANNWTPATVPISSSNVIISTAPNAPSLSANTSLNNFSMTAGAVINVNGFTLTIAGDFDIFGGTLNNTSAITDIVITLTGGATNYFRGTTVNDNITINQNNNNIFYEAYQAGNTFNGNVTFNANGTGATLLCYDNQSKYNGNLTILRSIAGASEIFRVGTLGVTGNFTYTNNFGGQTNIGQNGGPFCIISGTMNVTSSPTGNPNFFIYRTRNRTNGGTISIQNPGYAEIVEDSLLVTNLNLTGYVSGSTTDVRYNTIGGNLTMTEASGNTGGAYLRGNIVNGNTVITCNSAAAFYEGYVAANTFNGNYTFTTNGAGTAFLCYDQQSKYNGNVSVTRTAAGASNIFNVGTLGVTGNFSYTNNFGGQTNIGQNGGPFSIINGTMNITSSPTGNPNFFIYRTKNKINGGTISIQNPGYAEIVEDSLLVTNLNLIGYVSGSTTDVRYNTIGGNLTMTEASGNTGGTYLRGNIVNGNTVVTCNGVNPFYEGYVAANTFNGNYTFTANGAGTVFLCYDQQSKYNGNVSVTRTAAGNSNIFNVGTLGVTGNFSYTNSAGGITAIGQNGGAFSVVNGSFAITSNFSIGNPDFYIFRTKNKITGGICSITNPGWVQVLEDSLNINSFAINGFSSGSTTDIRDNVLNGTVAITERATNGGSVYIRRNRFGGNYTYTHNAVDILYEAYVGANDYIGDATFVRNAGTILLAYDNPTNFYQSMFWNSASGISINQPLNFKGANNGFIEQLGTQQIIVPTMLLQKTGGSSLTLNDELQISGSLTFTSGYIVSATTKLLKFLNAATATAFSNSSYTSGPVSKVGNQAFIFPIGDGFIGIQTAAISAPTNATDEFRAQYFASSANPTYNTSSIAGTLNKVSSQEYWLVDRLVGTSDVFVTLEYGAPRGVANSNVQTDLRVARWSGTVWANEGNSATTGTIVEGTVTSAAAITSFSPFTIGSTTAIDPLSNTPALLSVCANTNLSINFLSSGIFNAGNIFTAQLSNASGSFATPLNIGSITVSPNGMNVANSITSFLPSSAIPSGSGYRIRVISSNPSFTGSNNTSNININSVYLGADVTVYHACPSQTTNLLPLYSTVGLTAVWNTGTPTAVPPGLYRLDVVNGSGCRDTAFATVVLEVATWTGTVSNDWHNAANWNIAKVPTANTHVIVPTSTPNPCVVSGADATAASLQVRVGGTLQVINSRKILIGGTCMALP
jgi:hypothetical protein